MQFVIILVVHFGLVTVPLDAEPSMRDCKARVAMMDMNADQTTRHACWQVRIERWRAP